MKSRHPNSALEGLQGFQGIRSSPSMSWETSKLRPAFFGNRPMSRSRGPPQWKSLLIFQWIWLEGGWIPSTLVDLTWIHTEISHFYVSTVVFLEVGGWNPTVYHGHRIEIASELWILCLTRQDHRIGFSFFVLTSCPYWCWERPGSSAAQTVDGVFMPLWSLLWSNLWNAFLAVSGQSSVWTSCEMRFLWWKKRSNRSWVFPLNFQQNILLIFTCICFLIPEAFFLCLEVHMTAAVTHSTGTSRPGASEFNQSDWFSQHIADASWYEILGMMRWWIHPDMGIPSYHVTKYWYTDILPFLYEGTREISPEAFTEGWHAAPGTLHCNCPSQFGKVWGKCA